MLWFKGIIYILLFWNHCTILYYNILDLICSLSPITEKDKHYGLNMKFPPQTLVLRAYPQCSNVLRWGLERWLDHKGANLISGLIH